MDEDQDNGGFGSLAWYQLGRWSVQGEQSRRELVDRLTGNTPVARHSHHQAVQRAWELDAENEQLHAQNQQVRAANVQLRAHIAALNQSVQGWERDYQQLKDRADETEAGGIQKKWELEDEIESLQERIAALEQELREARGDT